MEKQLQRSRAVLPMGTVMKLTDLSARQIRYYETQALVKPVRNEGNRRQFSLIDVDRLLEIKNYLDEGFNIAEIKQVYAKQARHHRQQQQNEHSVSDEDVRQALHNEFLNIAGLNRGHGTIFPADNPSVK
ncbi:MerR family transcriptional regulator [Pediococcus cellicola]|uniref:Glutamine synthetase repressor n=1 Tax=Pediococcus cellicola TaxID=319652 RepID=A0A0R2IRE8_9LACO|nr:MerR family transcriptional regulator [Pediococcus cellicola]KRN67713.1 glutamine synthetase repressor [Pediococcus cellicola]GEL14296.1 MerR family transcriptional regulator [Pediococcus cellicola]